VIIARIITAIIIAVLIANFKLNLFGNAGWKVEETVLLMKAIAWAVIAWWASKERDVPEFDARPTFEQQLQSLEDMPTKVRSSSTTMDQFGFETVTSSSQTSAIISSIIGQSEDSSQQNIQQAIGTLGITDSQQSIVAAPVQQVIEAPIPQVIQQPIEHALEPSQVIEAQPLRVNVERVPLPHEDPDEVVTPTIPGLEEGRVFASEELSQVPLPDLDEFLSSLPSLDGLLEDADNVEQKVTSDLEDLLPTLPELPEIDLQQDEKLPPAISQITTPTPELPDLDGLF
jgi:hypothetical protein